MKIFEIYKLIKYIGKNTFNKQFFEIRTWMFDIQFNSK